MVINEPPFINQLAEARRVLETEGPEALRNPHAALPRPPRAAFCILRAALAAISPSVSIGLD